MPDLVLLLGIATVLLLIVITAMYVREARRPPRRSSGYALAHRLPMEPADINLRADEWSVTTRDGTTLPVWTIDGDAAEGTVIFIHGWGQSRISMLQRLGAYRPHARMIVLYDLRGHGAADGISRLSVDEADDLRDVVDRLDDPGPVTLVGWSMGAIIAFDAAARRSPVPERIIAYGVYETFRQSFDGRVRRRDLPTWPFTALAMSWFRLRGLRHRPTSSLLDEITCPVHLLHGRRDTIAPIADAHRLAERRSNVTVHEFAAAQHLDMAFVESGRHANVVRCIMEVHSNDQA